MLQDCSRTVNHPAQRYQMGLSRNIALAILVGIFCAISSANAQQPTPSVIAAVQPGFEVATVKPSKPDSSRQDYDSVTDRVNIRNYSLRQLIREAYGLKSDSQILGGPKWIDKQRYDISAKIDDAEITKERAMTDAESDREDQLMLQSLLTERFQLKVSRAQRLLPVYALVIAKSGVKITSTPAAQKRHDLSARNGHLTATGITMDTLADFLTGQFENENRVIINRTGLAGNYDFKLDWTRDLGDGIPPDAAFPGLLTALREQLGLDEKPGKALIPVIVVESASEPALD